MRRPDGVRARPPFVTMLSVRNDPWRSKGVSGPHFRSELSVVSSEAVTVIYRELARSGQNLASLHANEGAVDRPRADPHGSGSALRRHVIRECSDPHCRAIGSARNRPRGVGPGGEFALRPRPKTTVARDRARRWRRGSPRCNLCSRAP